MRLEVFLLKKECHVNMSVTGQVKALFDSKSDQTAGVYGTARVEDRGRGMDACQSDVQELGGTLEFLVDAAQGKACCNLCFPFEEGDLEGRT